MGAAITFPERYRNLRNGGFSVCVKEFCAVCNDGSVLLLGAGKEAGNIHQGNQGDVEGVAEAHEAGGLPAGIDIQHAGKHLGLVGHNSHASACKACKTNNYVLGKVLVNLKELSVIYNAPDDSVHVVGLVGVVRDN